MGLVYPYEKPHIVRVHGGWATETKLPLRPIWAPTLAELRSQWPKMHAGFFDKYGTM